MIMISIRQRLTLLLCLAVGALFVTSGLGVFLAMQGLLTHHFDETLTAKARALITASEIDDGDFEIDLTVQDFAGFGPGGEDYFELHREGGRLFMTSPSLGGAGFRITDDRRMLTPIGEQPRIYPAKLGDGRPARFYIQAFQPKDDDEKRFGDLYLVVASPTRAMRLQLALLGIVLVVTGAAAMVVMVPVIRLGLRTGLKPLERLSQDVHAIRPNSLYERLEPARLPAELVPVATSLNEWIQRLEASFERERMFSSHAAHELRTPLTELKSMAELGATWPEEANQNRCAEMLAVTTEMESLLDKLALLASTDAGRQPVSLEPVPLVESIHAAISRLSDLAELKDIHFETDVEDGYFETDPILWTTIVQNLLGNAVSHAPEGSNVHIKASPGSLRVSNPAPELSSADLDRVFDRFWRKDESRTNRRHSGLGMSIVMACASLLGRRVEASLTDNGDFEVRVDTGST